MVVWVLADGKWEERSFLSLKKNDIFYCIAYPRPEIHVATSDAYIADGREIVDSIRLGDFPVKAEEDVDYFIISKQHRYKLLRDVILHLPHSDDREHFSRLFHQLFRLASPAECLHLAGIKKVEETGKQVVITVPNNATADTMDQIQGAMQEMGVTGFVIPEDIHFLEISQMMELRDCLNKMLSAVENPCKVRCVTEKK